MVYKLTLNLGDIRTHLFEILSLNFASGGTHFATGLVRRGLEEQLVHHYVVSVDIKLGQFLHQALCLKHAQELGYAHANKSRLFLENEQQFYIP